MCNEHAHKWPQEAHDGWGQGARWFTGSRRDAWVAHSLFRLFSGAFPIHCGKIAAWRDLFTHRYL